MTMEPVLLRSICQNASPFRKRRCSSRVWVCAMLKALTLLYADCQAAIGSNEFRFDRTGGSVDVEDAGGGGAASGLGGGALAACPMFFWLGGAARASRAKRGVNDELKPAGGTIAAFLSKCFFLRTVLL